MVAHGYPLGTVFPDANVHSHDIVWIRFPPHMASRPPVRPTWSGRSRVRRRGSRTCTGLRIYGKVPGMGLLRARTCTRVCNFGGIRRPGDPGPRYDAANRRPRFGRPAGAAPVRTGRFFYSPPPNGYNSDASPSYFSWGALPHKPGGGGRRCPLCYVMHISPVALFDLSRCGIFHSVSQAGPKATPTRRRGCLRVRARPHPASEPVSPCRAMVTLLSFCPILI